MQGLYYQLKSVCRDRFCIMSFLLPIAVALVLQLMGSIDLSAVGELHFGILENAVSEDTVMWLERYGTVTEYENEQQLIDAVNEPSTALIGVATDGSGIKTIVSGDEFEVFRITADTLPELYHLREAASYIPVRKMEQADIMEGYQNLFMVLTLIVAMFMGCTFNAVNMISEKEDGVAFVNEILPMSRTQYALQKISIGFLFGLLSAFITALIGMRLSFMDMVILLAMIILSAFVASLFGLLIGKISEGLMVGIVYIKIVMILFMATPVFAYLMNIQGILRIICNVIPSTATFHGVMAFISGNRVAAITDVLILGVHSAGWFFIYLVVEKRKKQSIAI